MPSIFPAAPAACAVASTLCALPWLWRWPAASYPRRWLLLRATWMASPQDPFGAPGPYEEAVLNTPLLEEFARAEDFTGIDILRTIRSFDPCMPCTVHMAAGGRVLHRDATTCMCGDED